jgi:small GTP-binding protein
MVHTTIKTLLIGDSACGKTSFLSQFMYDQVPQQYMSTIGIDFAQKSVTLSGDETSIRPTYLFQLWDTAGHQRFRSIARAYYQNTFVFLLFFNINQQESLTSLAGWLSDIRAHSVNHSSMIMLIGTHADTIFEPRIVSAEEIQKWCKTYGISAYYELSTRDVDRVYATMLDITRAVHTHLHARLRLQMSAPLANARATKRFSISKCCCCIA